MNIFILLSCMFIVTVSCEKRDWDNPFDPDCPKEAFTPSDFQAQQEESVVNLSWKQSNTKISGFRIERKVGDSAWEEIATEDKNKNTWSDPEIAGGKQHEYRIYAYAGSNTSNQVTTQITPLFTATVSTTTVSNITSSSVTSGGNISDDGGAPITSRGVCWNTTGNPTILDDKTLNGTGSGVFISQLTQLSPNTTYYVRAYAINNQGTAYGSQVSFTTLSITDADGNVYKIVNIGTQIWMAENLKTTKFNDYSLIPLITDGTAWANLRTPGYCWYNNDQANYGSTYGALYNWHTVNSGKLCPDGWHVPSDAEWKELEIYLGMTHAQADETDYRGIDQGTQMKNTSGWGNDGNGTNSCNFSALPGGRRIIDGSFNYLRNVACWWSSTELDTSYVWFRLLSYSDSKVFRMGFVKEGGMSVRCIKN